MKFKNKINNDKNYIKLDKKLLDKLIYYIYKNNIPDNEILKYTIKLFNKCNAHTELYLIFNLNYYNSKKIYNDNSFIYEYITFFDDYSPLLNYYDNNNIKYDKIIQKIDLETIQYLKFDKYINFCIVNNMINELPSKDKYFLNFIDDIYNNNKYNLKFLYILNTNNKNVNDIDYIIDIIKTPSNLHLKTILP